MNAAKRLGVDPVITASEMADPEVDHLGVMAYAARLQLLAVSRAPPPQAASSRRPPQSTAATSSSALPSETHPVPTSVNGTTTTTSVKPTVQHSEPRDVAVTKIKTTPLATTQQIPSLADTLKVTLASKTYLTGKRVSISVSFRCQLLV
jgi:hypothetical protein